jgi:CRP-like cAMP-binding protein
VVSEGEVGIALFRVGDGWAFRYRRCSDGSRQILDFVLPGELIGLQAALFGTLDHSVASLTPLQLTKIDGRLVGEAFREFPSVAERLTRHLAAEARRADRLMTVIGCCNALQRLCFLIVTLYQRQRQRGLVDEAGCPFPLRRQHVADALGLTGAHVNRTINRLHREGVVALDGNRLAILDTARLHELAQADA